MIRHLVFFTARDPADLPTMRATLQTLAGIPGVRAFEVGVVRHHGPPATDAVPDAPDLVVHAVLDDEAALAAYVDHPIYRASTAIVRPLRELRIAADYEVEAPAPPAPDPSTPEPPPSSDVA